MVRRDWNPKRVFSLLGCLCRHLQPFLSYALQELRSQCLTSVPASHWHFLILINSGDVHPHTRHACGENVFPCVWCEINVLAAVGLYAAMIAANDTTDPVSVYHKRNILNVRWLMRTHLIFKVTKCRPQILSFCFMTLVMIQCLIICLHQCSSREVVHLTQAWPVPLTQAFLEIFIDPLCGSIEVAMLDNCTMTKHNLHSLVLNSNSVKKKLQSSRIYDTRPDTSQCAQWNLYQSISPRICKNWTLHGRGVMISVWRGFTVDKIPLNDMKKNCELVFAQVTQAGEALPLCLGPYYIFQTDNSSNKSLDGLEAELQHALSLVSNTKAGGRL